jgi:molecular chaperone GrpE
VHGYINSRRTKLREHNSPSQGPEEAAEKNPEQPDVLDGDTAEDQEPEEQLDPVAALTKERDELKDQLLRVMAETENFKKRAQRDQAQFLKRANESLVKDMLPVLDNLERALEAAQDNGETSGVIEGLELIQRDFLKVLEKNGLEEVEAMGQPFDPEYHEAMMQQDDAEADENTVLCVYQKGYTFHDRLIRPAMVVVSKKPAGSYTESGEEAECDDKGKKIDIKIN